MIKSSIKEAHVRDASKRMNRALNFIATMPQDNKSFREAYSLLLNVKRVNNKKYNIQADDEIEKLKTSAFNFREQKKRQRTYKTLKDLKNRSYQLENSGNFKSALQMWTEYQRNGAYANELKQEIQSAISFLNNKLNEKSSSSEGID
jgi:hypothetical protein